MMAHNLSAHALSSTLNRRASPHLSSQDHMISSCHVPILSVPDIFEAFHQTHPSGTTNICNNSLIRSTNTHADPWELPELKWLDAAGNNVMASIDNPAEPSRFAVQSLSNSVSEKSGLDGGERWQFSELYAGDQVAANSASAVDDRLIQFSSLSTVTASPPRSGSSMVRRKSRGVSSRTNISNFASGDFPMACSTPSDRCTDTTVNTPTPTGSSGSHKRHSPGDRPDSDLTQEMSNSRRADFKIGAENFLADGLISKRQSPSTILSFPAEKRRRLQDGGAKSARDSKSTGPDQKTGAEKGSATNSAVEKQAVSPGGEASKKSAASVAAATATVSDHEIHIWTERERRKKMNGMFTTLHSLLPHLASKADKSTIVDEAINYIQSLEVTMKGMQKRKCEMAISSDVLLPSSSRVLLQASKHGGSSMTVAAETDKISPGNISLCGLNVNRTSGSVNSVRSTSESHSLFQTLCSPNIVLNICGMDAFITICSPRRRSGLLCRVLFVMESHRLLVVNANISTTDDTNLFMLHAQSADQNQLSNLDMLNITLQDLTNCLSTTQ